MRRTQQHSSSEDPVDQRDPGPRFAARHFPAPGPSWPYQQPALQAFLAAQLALAIGARIGERWRSRAEQVAGAALILLGAYLITEQLFQ